MFEKYRRHILSITIILILIFLSYYPALNSEFLNWDDNVYLTENYNVRVLNFQRLAEFFFDERGTVGYLYSPLAILSFAIEYHFFEYDPFIYHLNNILLHIFNSILIYLIIVRLGLSISIAFLASLLFGIHPMHVEPVAWVTERKDVLYTFFYLLSLHSYWSYLKREDHRQYFGSIIFGILSVLAKPMALSLPLVLFLFDWFYKRRLTKVVFVDKIPYFLSIVPVVWTTYVMHARVPGHDFFEGILIWVWSFTFYIQKFLFPLILVPLYQLPKPVSLANGHYLLSSGLMFLIVWSVIRFRRNRLYIFAWAYYALSVFYLMRFDDKVDHTIVADRYMYLPSLGFCIFLAYSAVWILSSVKSRAYKGIVFAGLISIFAFCFFKTYAQCQIWKDSLTFWNHVIDNKTEENISMSLAYAGRGSTFLRQNRLEEAIVDLNKGLALNPLFAEGYSNRGAYYIKKGELDLAMRDINLALKIKPDYSQPYANRGYIFNMIGNYEEAVKEYTTSLKHKPYVAESYFGRALAYRKSGQMEKAIKDYTACIENKKTFAAAYNNRGNLYKEQGKYQLAIADFNQAIALRDDYAEAYQNRGVVYRLMNKFDNALQDLNTALSLKPDYLEAYFNRGYIHLVQYKLHLAIKDYTEVLKLDPQYSNAYLNRSVAYNALGQRQKALEDALKAQASGEKVKTEYLNQLQKP